MVIGLAFLVMLIGGLVYYLAANGKVAEMGRIAFFVGLLFVVGGAAQVVALLVK